ncbi:MAG: hypothetical protein ACWA5P_07550 [bacterium]
MRIIQSKFLRKTVGVIFILTVSYLLLNWYAQHKAIKLLRDAIPSHVHYEIQDLNLSTLGRSATFNEVSFSIQDTLSDEKLAEFNVKQLQFQHFSVLDYFIQNKIHLHKITIADVSGYLLSENKQDLDSTKHTIKKPLDHISLSELELKNINIEIRKAATDSMLMKVSDLNLNIDAIELIKEEDNRAISYDHFNLKSDTISLNLGPLNRLNISTIKGDEQELTFQNVALKTKYSPKELRSRITSEKDFFDVTIDSLVAIELPKVFHHDQPLELASLTLKHPKVFIYRDKLVKDDLSIKPMLSEQIRRIPKTFNIGQFDINNAHLTYKERTQVENDGGSIIVNNLTVAVENFSNQSKYQPLNLDITANFKGNSDVKAHWQFDALDERDRFTFSTDAKQVDLAVFNTFSKPNFNTEMEGQLEQLYYTISGNKHSSTIAVKSKYSNVRVAVLRRNKRGRNKFYSSMANMFVSTNSKRKKSDFQEASVEVTRDQTKSVFNFIFKNVEKGMMKVLL